MDSRWGLAHFHDRVIAYRPDTVFIEFTINDALAGSKLSVAESMGNLEKMIGMLRHDRPYCDVIVMVMNPPTGEALKKRPQVDAYQNGYRLVAKKLACRFINFNPVWKSLMALHPQLWQSYAPDGLHPNKDACREVVLPYLLKAIGYRSPDLPSASQ